MFCPLTTCAKEYFYFLDLKTITHWGNVKRKGSNGFWSGCCGDIFPGQPHHIYPHCVRWRNFGVLANDPHTHTTHTQEELIECKILISPEKIEAPGNMMCSPGFFIKSPQQSIQIAAPKNIQHNAPQFKKGVTRGVKIQGKLHQHFSFRDKYDLVRREMATKSGNHRDLLGKSSNIFFRTYY